MKNNILAILSLLLLFSCSNNRDFEIVDLKIGEQEHVIGDHFDSEMSLCFKNQIGKGDFSFSLFVITNNGREFKFSHDVYVDSHYTDVKSTDKCVTFSLRPFFTKKGFDEEDLLNLKSMAKGNIKEVRVGIWNSTFDKFVAEKTFYDL